MYKKKIIFFILKLSFLPTKFWYLLNFIWYDFYHIDLHTWSGGHRSIEHIEAKTKCPPFCRQHFQMHSYEWKCINFIGEVSYCFSRSYVKFQGHTALKIVEFDPNWPFPYCNSSLNSPMAMKCCTKLETAKERCPIVFQGHPSNFKVTRDKTSLILTQIGRFRTIGRSQVSNPSDLPCCFSNTNV